MIQRDDGALKNASVHPDALSTATKALIGAGNTGQNNWTPRGAWVTATLYALGDVVENSSISYVCAVEHTSGVFATDRTAGKWIVLGQTFTAGASSVSADPYGHVSAVTVQNFLQELVDEKALLNGSVSQQFSIADASDDAHALSMGQAQKDSVIYAVGGGSSDALTATLVSGLTTLSDGMHVRVEAAATNTTTTPTLNLTLGSTATGAKTIKKGALGPLVAGDIAGAEHKLELVYSISGDCWLLQNPAYSAGTSTFGVEPQTIENFGLSFSAGSGAMVATVKTSIGGVPTASDPVRAALRSSSAATGTYNTRTIAGSIDLTIPSSATLGHQSAAPGVLHWYLIDNAGSLELAVSSHFHGFSGIVSTTAISAAATSATVMYSASARSSVAFVWCGRTIDTQTTAGTWASTPTFVSLVRSLEHALQALQPGQLLNGKVTFAVGSSALTIAIKTLAGNDPSASDPVWAMINSSTLTTSERSVLPITAATSLVISSGSTLGHASAIAQHIFGYLLDATGVVELAVSNCPPDYPGLFGNVRRVSTTAEGGAGAADSPALAYSTTARTNVAWAALFMAKSTQATAGTWAAVPTQVDMAPFSVPSNYVYATRSTNQSINSSTFTKVAFATEVADADTVFDAATNNRFQPNVAGVHNISYGAHFEAVVDTSLALVLLYKNGSVHARAYQGQGAAAKTIGGGGSFPVSANGTSDYFEVFVWQDTGGAVNLAADGSQNYISSIRVGQKS